MDSSPSFHRRAPDDPSDSPENMVVPDHALPHISFRTPSHGTGTSGAGSSTGSMAGENPTTLHPAMHLSTITPPQPVEPHEMMTPDPNARYIHVRYLSSYCGTQKYYGSIFHLFMFTIDVQGDQVHQDCIPKENMVFATEEEGYAFYMQYARAAGFGSKKHKNKAMSRVYACSRQGSSEFYKEAEKRKRGKMSKRIGCMASVKLKLRGKEWFYERVELEHNHTLNPDPCEVKHMRSHKNKHPVMMDYVDGLQHSGVSPNATVNVLTELHGDYGHMLMNARDLENREGPTFSWSQHEFKVVCNEEEEKYTCECRGWEHTGLLCPHLIIVLINEQIQKIPSQYVLRRYSRNAHIDLPYDRNDTVQTGPDGSSLSCRNSDLLSEAFATVQAGRRSTVAYKRAMTVLKELRKQLEEIPADEMPVRGEPATHDEDGHLGTVLKAPPKSKTKGSRTEAGAEQIIGARGPKLCTRHANGDFF
ncbi:hypothetical protein ACQ4PT_039998 [Festuca glaucescens]